MLKNHYCLSGVKWVLKKNPGWSASQLSMHFLIRAKNPLPISAVLESSHKSEPSGQFVHLPLVKNLKSFNVLCDIVGLLFDVKIILYALLDHPWPPYFQLIYCVVLLADISAWLAYWYIDYYLLTTLSSRTFFCFSTNKRQGKYSQIRQICFE